MEKNIAFLVPCLSNGGAERVVSYLSENFPDKCNKYVIVYYTNDQQYSYGGELINLNIKPSNTIIGKCFNYVRRIIKLKRIKKVYNIHKTISFLDGPNVVNILSRYNDNVIISIRNHRTKELQGEIKNLYKKIMIFIYKKVIRFIYNKADRIVAISKGVQDDLIKTFGINREKVKVIYNPIDLKKIENLCEEDIESEYEEIFRNPVIINVGRLTDQKGQWHLIRSFGNVVKEIPNAKLVILGQGQLREYLRELINVYNLEESVFILGFKENPFKYIKRSKIFILSSLFEGFGNVLIEAMCCGVPIISTDCESGPREIIAPSTSIYNIIEEISYEENGVLIPNLDGVKYDPRVGLTKEEKIMGNAITNMLLNEQLLQKYKKHSNNRVKDFDVKLIVEKWRDI